MSLNASLGFLNVMDCTYPREVRRQERFLRGIEDRLSPMFFQGYQPHREGGIAETRSLLQTLINRQLERHPTAGAEQKAIQTAQTYFRQQGEIVLYQIASILYNAQILDDFRPVHIDEFCSGASLIGLLAIMAREEKGYQTSLRSWDRSDRAQRKQELFATALGIEHNIAFQHGELEEAEYIPPNERVRYWIGRHTCGSSVDNILKLILKADRTPETLIIAPCCHTNNMPYPEGLEEILSEQAWQQLVSIASSEPENNNLRKRAKKWALLLIDILRSYAINKSLAQTEFIVKVREILKPWSSPITHSIFATGNEMTDTRWHA